MKINILAIAKYLPQNRIASSTLDQIAKGKIGRIEKNTGVQFRHHISGNETICEMGATVLKNALQVAELTPKDIDLLLFAGACFDYPVPHNSVLIKSKITDDSVNFNCIDIHTTCLSFLSALEIAHLYLQSLKYKRIAIVCSEISSLTLTPKDEKVFGLFGDGAAAIVIESSPEKGYLPAHTVFKNYPSGALYAQVPIGGINRGFYNTPEDDDYYFKMDGKSLIRLTTKHLPAFIEELEKNTGYKITDFDKIVTHQTSRYGNEYLRKTFKLKDSQVVETLAFYGNCISASLPLGLAYLWDDGYDFEGKKILLLGTGAGLTIGAMVLVF